MWISSSGVGDVIRIGGDITVKILHITNDRVALGLISGKEEHPPDMVCLPKVQREQAIVHVRIAT